MTPINPVVRRPFITPRKHFALTGFCLLVLLIFVGYTLYRDHLFQKAIDLIVNAVIDIKASQAKTSATAVVPVAVPPLVQTPSKPSLLDQLRKGLVHQAQGLESPMIRQLFREAQDFGFQGDVTDAGAVKRWADTKAHQIALAVGFVASDYPDAWMGIKAPDRVSVVLQHNANGEISVAIYLTNADGSFGSSSQPDKVLTVASNGSHAQFMGLPEVMQQHPLPSYMYSYVG